MLVTVDGGAGERVTDVPGRPPRSRCPSTSRRSERAGADEAILVLDPITEASVRRVAAVLR